MTKFIYQDFEFNMYESEFVSFIRKLQKVRSVKFVYSIEKNCLEVITTKKD